MNKSGFSLIETMLSCSVLLIISKLAITGNSVNQANIDTQLLKLFLERQFLYSSAIENEIEVICMKNQVFTKTETLSLKTSNINCGSTELKFYPDGISMPRTIEVANSRSRCFLKLSLRGQIRKIC